MFVWEFGCYARVLVLLPWPSGSKGGRRKWEHVQLSDMAEPRHLAKVERAGNIGVALGEVSNRLVTIDFDQDGYVDAFLAANPLLKTTLRTRGSQRTGDQWTNGTRTRRGGGRGNAHEAVEGRQRERQALRGSSER